MNWVCELPNRYIVVSYWARHPCGGSPYMLDAVCWGRDGAVGRWFPEAQR